MQDKGQDQDKTRERTGPRQGKMETRDQRRGGGEREGHSKTLVHIAKNNATFRVSMMYEVDMSQQLGVSFEKKKIAKACLCCLHEKIACIIYFVCFQFRLV